jgi:hypothetical protein
VEGEDTFLEGLGRKVIETFSIVVILIGDVGMGIGDA